MKNKLNQLSGNLASVLIGLMTFTNLCYSVTIPIVISSIRCGIGTWCVPIVLSSTQCDVVPVCMPIELSSTQCGIGSVCVPTYWLGLCNGQCRVFSK